MPSHFALICAFALAYTVPLATYAAASCKTVDLRQEWRTLSDDIKADWLAGVKCLASLRHHRLSLTSQGTELPGLHSLYDDFAYTHDALDETAHENAYFLPWHRWFVHLFEESLRQKCGYSGPIPYWDWTLDADDLFASPIFDPDLHHGLGQDGDCVSSDCTIRDGALSRQFTLAFPVPHMLRRNMSLGDPPRTASLNGAHIANVSQSSTPGDFFTFQYHMSRAHNHLHNFVGGDMATRCPKEVPEDLCTHSYASNDPLFWLHHAQLDRLWSKWQSAHPENLHAFAGYPLHSHNLSNPLYDVNASVGHWMHYDRLSVPIAVAQVFNHTAAPLCYDYAAGPNE
ncbi:Di-copper centre-containing protein [Artomyces pyxidatus]|uniref:Di-copper centre-containing protein n=1 Tax=Artomyces pyxidatus TaxID=48021 RepID=A0ACB8SU39_9AGAM|nr:Di-copper centre-containing protein [Artomyces pyxidatus]